MFTIFNYTKLSIYRQETDIVSLDAKHMGSSQYLAIKLHYITMLHLGIKKSMTLYVILGR